MTVLDGSLFLFPSHPAEPSATRALLEETKAEMEETDAWKTAYTNSTFVEADGGYGIQQSQSPRPSNAV